MATNPIPKDSVNLSVNVSKEIHSDLKRLAKQSSMTLSQYVRYVLTVARDGKLQVKTRYRISESAPLLAAEDPPK